MRLFILFFIGFLCFQSNVSFAQNQKLQQTHAAVIWNGFQHEWTYNHRMNRIGNFVNTRCAEPHVAHCSATGIGADSTFYSTAYTIIESPTTRFQSGKISLSLFSKEGKMAQNNIEVSIPANQYLSGKSKLVTLLNGFDMMALDRADKIQMLKIDMGDPHYVPLTNEIRFSINVALIVDCQSFECNKFNQKAAYKMDVHYLILGGNEELHSQNFLQSRHFDWDKKDNPELDQSMAMIQGIGNNQYAVATLGFKSIHLTLDQAHWMIEWNNQFKPIEYAPSSGKYFYSLDLLFNQWEDGMKKYSATPKQSKFSSRKKGWASLTAQMTLLQFKDAKLNYKKVDGNLYWPGKNLEAASGESIHQTPIFKPAKMISNN